MQYKKIHGKYQQRKQAQSNRRKGRRKENKIVDKMGFTRAGAYGAQDGYDDLCSVEVKSKKAYAGDTMFQQAVKNAKDKIPLLIVHKDGRLLDNAIVHMSLKDWLRMYYSAKAGV